MKKYQKDFSSWCGECQHEKEERQRQSVAATKMVLLLSLLFVGFSFHLDLHMIVVAITLLIPLSNRLFLGLVEETSETRFFFHLPFFFPVFHLWVVVKYCQCCRPDVLTNLCCNSLEGLPLGHEIVVKKDCCKFLMKLPHLCTSVAYCFM